VDTVPDPLLFSGSAGNRTRVSGSVAVTYIINIPKILTTWRRDLLVKPVFNVCC
jgi:hypothetical protein